MSNMSTLPGALCPGHFAMKRHILQFNSNIKLMSILPKVALM